MALGNWTCRYRTFLLSQKVLLDSTALKNQLFGGFVLSPVGTKIILVFMQLEKWWFYSGWWWYEVTEQTLIYNILINPRLNLSGYQPPKMISRRSDRMFFQSDLQHFPYISMSISRCLEEISLVFYVAHLTTLSACYNQELIITFTVLEISRWL